jgi:hypothetical protein
MYSNEINYPALGEEVSGYSGRRVRDYIGDPEQTLHSLESLTPVAFGRLAGVIVYVAQNPRNVLGNVGVDARQSWMSTHDSPGHDAADKPAVMLVGVRTQQWSTRVTLKVKKKREIDSSRDVNGDMLDCSRLRPEHLVPRGVNIAIESATRYLESQLNFVEHFHLPDMHQNLPTEQFHCRRSRRRVGRKGRKEKSLNEIEC